MVGAFSLALWFLNYMFAEQSVKFDELALGPETTSVYPHLGGNRIHCKDWEDRVECLAPLSSKPANKKFLWLGNSQLHSINQRKPNQYPASLYLTKNLAKVDISAITFSQPNASLLEHWLLFEAISSEIKIDVLVLAIVFDDMREGQIRQSISSASQSAKIKEVLNNSAFGRRILSKLQDTTELDDQPETLQTASENWITTKLENCCGWTSTREQARGRISTELYQFRNSVFGISANSQRRIIPSHYNQNTQALRAITERARQLKTKVIAYVAPLRSDVERPYIAEEYEGFKTMVEATLRDGGGHYYDLENLVPSKYWGLKDSTNISGEPEIDFMHFQGEGHKILADELFHILEECTR